MMNGLTFKKSLKYLVVLALLALLVYAFLPQPVAVTAQPVERGTLRLTHNAEGRTRVKDIFVVTTPVAGRIHRIELEAGDRVLAGDVITGMTPSDPAFLDDRRRAQATADLKGAQAALDMAQSKWHRSQANVAFYRTEYQRLQRLHSEGSVSDHALEQARLLHIGSEDEQRMAQAEVELMRSQLQSAQALLSQPGQSTGTPSNCELCVRSPVDGQILRVVQESAAVLPAGAPLLEVGDVNAMELVVDMLSQNAVQVRQGQRAQVNHWGGSEAIEAVVRRVEPGGFTKISALGIEEQRVNIILDLLDQQPVSLGLGDAFRVEVEITVHEQANALMAPLSALYRLEDRWMVFVVDDDGRARQREVNIGLKNDLSAEILQGLVLAETLITHPPAELADGDRVVIQR